ncbi:small nuclear ribonucleo protein SmF, partial [Metschnikowia bicuspidata var. bicuspidata NRRL YB-4993]
FQPINPKPFLKTLLNKPVVIRLKWNKLEYRGTLVAIDNYMNLQLEDASEVVKQDATEPSETGEPPAGDEGDKIGDIFIRCNNVLFVRENTNTALA